MPARCVEQWVRWYARRIWWGEYLRSAADLGAVFFFVFGGAILAAKLALPSAWPHVLWLALGAVPCAAAAWWLARPRAWTDLEAAARLDAALNTGGLLMTLTERPDQEWQARLPHLEQEWRNALPRLRPKRFASYLALPLLFAVGACLVPLREAASENVSLNTTGMQAARALEELLEQVHQEKLLGSEEKERLEQELKQLAQEAQTGPLTHEKWEAVDALRERLVFRVEAAAQQVSKAKALSERLAAAEAGDLPDITSDEIEQLQKELSKSLDQLAQNESLRPSALKCQECLQRLAKSRGKGASRAASAERRKALEQLRETLESEHRKLADLRGKCEKCGQCNSGPEDGSSEGNRSDKGGVTRGRGDAELTWGDETEDARSKFKAVVLPQGLEDLPKDDVVGLQKRDPIAEPAEAAPRANARTAESATGSTAVNRNLRPRHRNVVKEYFKAD